LRPEISSRIISRIKILGQINISERRLPQDGRVTFKLGKQIIDVRISTLPTGSGERVVMRMLGKQNQLIKLNVVLIISIQILIKKLCQMAEAISQRIEKKAP